MNKAITEHSQVFLLFLQLFMALSDLKQLGILHTDLKPDNIMLVDERELKIKIIDFGLALLTHEAKTGTIMQASGLRLFLLY